MILASGVYDWAPRAYGDIAADSFSPVFAESDQIEFLLFGTGDTQIFPSSEIRASFEHYQLGLEVMSTGAACRTFNVLLAEERRVAAALLAVE